MARINVKLTARVMMTRPAVKLRPPSLGMPPPEAPMLIFVWSWWLLEENTVERAIPTCGTVGCCWTVHSLDWVAADDSCEQAFVSNSEGVIKIGNKETCTSALFETKRVLTFSRATKRRRNLTTMLLCLRPYLSTRDVTLVNSGTASA